jgi:hypothetical protein
MTRSKFLCVAALACAAALAATACADTKTPVADSTAATAAATAAAPATASRGDTVKVQGLWSDSVTAESAYLAEYVDGKLVVIEEQMMLADGTRSSRAYFYNAEYAPTRFFEHRALTAASGNSTPKVLHSLLNIYVSGYKIDSAVKRVDFEAKTVQPYEIENMRKHEREIFARVATTHSAPRTNR